MKVDEKLIQKEMLRNGPVVGEFKAPNKFRYYNNGILIDEDKPAVMRYTQVSDENVQVSDENLL